MRSGLTRERALLTALWAFAALGCVLGLAVPIHAGSEQQAAGQLLALARIACTSALAVVLLLGPGIAWRARRTRRIDLGLLPLPGLTLLTTVGGLAWALAPGVSPRVVCLVAFVPLLGWLLACFLHSRSAPLLTSDE